MPGNLDFVPCRHQPGAWTPLHPRIDAGPDQQLPIVQMRYWLVGAPAPGLPHEETLGADRRLAALSQSGWQVRYDRYEPVGGLALPARMEMTAPGLRLRVVVSDWRLAP